MKTERVWAAYWSATGNTRTVVECIAKALAEQMGCAYGTADFTLPAARAQALEFQEGDLVVLGTPTYAGKIPNKMLPYVAEQIHGNGALGVGVVTFGNRSYDNSLAELCAAMEKNGFHTVAGAAFVGRHAFTDKLAPGRPGEEDLAQAQQFAKVVVEKVRDAASVPSPVVVKGDAEAPYYVPKGTDGQPAKFLKAKPLTDMEKCNHCGVCVKLCPVGSIDSEDVSNVPGVCIKCQACIRGCSQHAKYFEDAAFLSHVAMLEQNFTARKENELFL